MIPVGTAMIIEVIMKEPCREPGRPTVNMWWAQTTIERNPIARVESTIAV